MSTLRGINALSAMREELFRFRFTSPLVVVPEAGPKESIHYYLYGKELSWGAMRLDSNGVPRLWQRTTGRVYNPAYIASYGLTNLGHYLRMGDRIFLDIFLRQVEWLEQHAVVRPDRAVVWLNDYDYREGSVLLKRPWVSANVQGFVISALVRGWRVTRRPHLIELLKNSASIFDKDVSQSGVRVEMEGRATYSEKPGLPAPGIMDGYMRSLLGLYDLFVETEDVVVKRLFDEGIEGLKHTLSWWDYRRKWSWYGNHNYLSPPSYHCLNHLLLTVLARLTGEATLSEYAEAWNPHNLSTSGRMEIYLGCLITKNACRLKHRTWKDSISDSSTGVADTLPTSSELAIGEWTEERQLQVLTLAKLGWSNKRITRATSVPLKLVRAHQTSVKQSSFESRRAPPRAALATAGRIADLAAKRPTRVFDREPET